jgi:hypothetical protein
MAIVNTNPALEKVEAQIRDLLSWEDNWNSYEAPTPDKDAVEHALGWISALYTDATELETSWLAPHVTASADGEVVFEWWRGAKKLTVYIGDGTAEYVQVWGANVDQDMAEGNADGKDARRRLWRWLVDA